MPADLREVYILSYLYSLFLNSAVKQLLKFAYICCSYRKNKCGTFLTHRLVLYGGALIWTFNGWCSVYKFFFQLWFCFIFLTVQQPELPLAWLACVTEFAVKRNLTSRGPGTGLGHWWKIGRVDQELKSQQHVMWLKWQWPTSIVIWPSLPGGPYYGVVLTSVFLSHFWIWKFWIFLITNLSS